MVTFSLVMLTALALPAAASLQPQGAAQGRALFEANCRACHSLGPDRLVGPGLEGVTQRRERAWLVAFIIEPDRVIAEGDSIALALLAEYQVPMPKLGLTAVQAESILDYLAEAEPTAAEAPGAAAAPGGDEARGRRLFTGQRRLANGGAACISCHSVAGLGAWGGGSLAKDLTAAAAGYGSGLAGMLQAPPFPAMGAVYASRPLTAGEVADLVAFLREPRQVELAGGGGLGFPAAGLVGMLALVVLAAVLWKGRLRGVRKPLIGEGR